MTSKAQQTCQYLLPGKPTTQHFTTAQQADYVKAAQLSVQPCWPAPGQANKGLPIND